MKGLFFKSFVLAAGSMFLATAVTAASHTKTMHPKAQWTCETNASAASSNADKKADEVMKKGSTSGRSAFEFAFKHCRDCTKITCSMESPSNSNPPAS